MHTCVGRVLPEVFRYIMTPDRTSLTIQRVRRADEGSFDCHAENSVGSVEAGARLVILALCTSLVRHSAVCLCCVQ